MRAILAVVSVLWIAGPMGRAQSLPDRLQSMDSRIEQQQIEIGMMQLHQQDLVEQAARQRAIEDGERRMNAYQAPRIDPALLMPLAPTPDR